jgi:hypothetical protein
LRMQCSSLNHHLFRKNIVNSPFCQCGATETTAHFLLHCPRHNTTRLRYIHTINLPINLNTDLLLFGSTDLTNILNTDIFLNVQKFIISSIKRSTSTIFNDSLQPYSHKLNMLKKKALAPLHFICLFLFFSYKSTPNNIDND